MRALWKETQREKEGNHKAQKQKNQRWKSRKSRRNEVEGTVNVKVAEKQKEAEMKELGKEKSKEVKGNWESQSIPEKKFRREKETETVRR